METPTKRPYQDIDPESSPEISSPEYKKAIMGDSIEAIRIAIQGMENRLQSLDQLKGMNETLGLIKDSVDSIQLRLEKTERNVEQLSSENTSLRKRVSQLEDRAIRQEAFNRRDNLILDGISTQVKTNLEAKVREVFRVNLKVPDADFMKFTRLHRLANSTKIIIRFHYYRDRDTVWANRRYLKDSGLWLEEDYPQEWRNSRQILYPILKVARDIPDVKATLSQDKLIVNSQAFTVDTLHLLPEGLSLQQVLHRHEGNVLFSGKSSPLSNFYPARFGHNGIVYKSSEHFYQETKAILNKDYVAAEDIRMMADPVSIYKRGQNVKVDNSVWTDGKRLAVMEEALMLKYTQNKHLRDVLLSTEEQVIWEARKQDTFFGAGGDAKELKRRNYQDAPGANHLGQLLMKVRSTIRDMNM